LRLIIVAVQVGAVKIYIAGVGRSGKKKDRMKLRKPTKLTVFCVSPPTLTANVLFCAGFFESHLVYDQTRGTHPVFS